MRKVKEVLCFEFVKDFIFFYMLNQSTKSKVALAKLKNIIVFFRVYFDSSIQGLKKSSHLKKNY